MGLDGARLRSGVGGLGGAGGLGLEVRLEEVRTGREAG